MKTRLVGFAALLALLGVVAGVPWLLLRWGADLTPDQLTLTDVLDVLLRPDDGTAALVAITVIAWIAWAVIGISVAVELVAVLRGVTAPRLPGLRLAAVGCPSARRRRGVAVRHRIPRVLRRPGRHTAGGGRAAHGSQRQPALDRGRQWLMTRTPALAASGNRGAARTHLVRTGDTLWGLAERYLGDGTRYRELARLNADQLDGQPGLLHPGMRLRIPNESDRDRPHTVTVKRGDTLTGIADRELGDPSRYRDIARASRHITQPGGGQLTDPDVIDIGWKLRIPADDPSTDPAAARRQADNQAGPALRRRSPGPAAAESRPAATHPRSGPVTLDPVALDPVTLDPGADLDPSGDLHQRRTVSVCVVCAGRA